MPPGAHLRPHVASVALLTLVGLGCGGSKRTPPPAADAPKVPTGTTAAQIGGCTPPSANEDIRTTDVNGDGVPEVCKYYREVNDPERPGQKRTLLVRQALDLNWDGKVDLNRSFAADGTVSREEWDADFDGRVDEVRYFEEGTIVRSERDQNNDGETEVVRFYKDGKLERKETDTNGDGKPDRWEYYRGRVLDRVGVDRDFDGKPDVWTRAERS